MNKTSYKVLTLTVGWLLMLSCIAERAVAWPCPPPRPPCHTCTPTGWEYDCTGCRSCVGGCSGCCKCSNCGCVDDSNKCDPDECCVGCNCYGPICENCHEINDDQNECGHTWDASEGSPCADDWCIKNVLESATCDHKPVPWPCPKVACDTTQDPPWAEIYQVILGPTSCSAGKVHWSEWHTLYYGCTTCSAQTWRKACEVTVCAGPFMNIVTRGLKKKCGGCP